ncbi:MAG: gliding motility-associated C-terminal domain-containing protein [Lewinellaceae bacterium]|nr:gliding motility-associated C-terminal domain-containing protein [Lewinellaceae bacterium]
MKKILLLLLSIMAAELAIAQQPPGSCPGNMAPLAPFCSQACVLCDIDGYIGMNVNQPVWEAPSTFCAPQFHSIQWIGFIAGSTSISFQISTLSCQTGNGLQAEIYQTTDCTSWTSVSNCDPGFTTTTLNASGLVPGNTYFFVIDGNGGDECEFQIDVLSGSATAPDVVGTPVINGPTNLCTGGNGMYSATGVSGAASYTWTLDGNIVGYDPQVQLGSLPTGSYQLCVQPANPCFGPGNSTCTTINVGPLPPENLNETLCFDELPFTYQGFSFSSQGSYNFSYTRPDGCEQPVNLNLNVIDPIPPTDIFADICLGEETYFFGGQAYGQTGVFPHIFTTADGCDSLVTLNLTAHPPTFTPLGFIDHCELLGPYIVGTTEISQQGDFTVTLTGYYGCDSIVAGYLNLTTPDLYVLDTTICEGEFIQVGQYIYSTSGNYQEEYTEPGGCQSMFNVTLNVYNPETTIDTTICPGETVTVGNSSYSSSGSYTKVLQAQYLGLGCDSTVFLNLTVIDPIVTNIQASICEGESYTLGPSTYTTSGNYSEVFTAANGCDSTVNLALTVHPNVETTIDTSICFASTFTVGDSTFAQTGNYSVLLQSAQGCDSTVFLNLTVKDAIITTLNESVCDGDSFSAGGMDFDMMGTYEVVLTAADGCDSTVVLNLDILNNPETTLNESICQGQSFQVGSSSYSLSGTYTDVFTAANGCDSTVTLNLNVIAPIVNNITRKICTGQSYTVGTSTYNQAGNYTDTLSNFIGCDSIVNLTLTIEDVIRDTLVTSICEGESYNVDGTLYTTTGFYDNDFVTASGCDSVFYLDLTVIPTRYTTLDEMICDGESFQVGSSTYTTTGNYQDLLTSVETGCDSIVSLNLTVLNVPRTSLTESICDGETYTVGTSDYTTTGVFVDTLGAANGCDSIVTLDLTVLDVPETNLVEDICDGEVYTVGTSDYTTSGNYTDVLVAANGCDSIVYLDLTVKDVPETFLVEEICQYETYTVGTSGYTTSGTYTDVLVAANGCDSIVHLDLTVFPERRRDLVISICNGSTYTVGSSTYNQAGNYIDTLASVVTGCDSIVTLDLTVTDFYEINLEEVICEFESYTVGTDVYTQTGQYTNMFISSDGCDSLVNLDLTVIPLPRTTLNETICDGESVSVGGIDYTLTGTFTDTLTSVASGCDSIVTLNLTVNEVFQTDLLEEICDGETYTVGTSGYTQTGVYQDVLTASNGCDSVVNLDLTVHPIPETNLVETICYGDTYPVGNSSYSTTGIYQDIIPSVTTGCDSIVNLDLTVRDEITTELTEVVCYGGDFTVGSSTYDATGTYQDILASVTGCDSIVTLNLTVRDEIRTGLEREICDGETYTVGLSDYTTTGIFVDTLTSLASGCDSIVTLDLTVHPIPVTNLDEAICDGETYTVGTSGYTTSGVYQDVLTSVVTGCDSIVNLDLTVHPIPVTNLTEVVCFGGSVPVGSNTYAATGTYQDVLTSVVTGCDSIVNLDLTVRDEIRTGLDQEICDGETYTVGTSGYTTSGIFIDTLASVATGCDSIVTLDLTVHPIPQTALVEEICDGETYTVGTSGYTTSGVYQDVLTSVVTGCDSIVNLDLTVHPIPVTNLVEQICDGEVYEVGLSDYTTSGTYQDVLSSVVTGCDSIVNLDLTVHPIPVTSLVEEICDGETYSVGTSGYTTSGVYQDVLASVITGCDSIVNLDLTVHPIPQTSLVEEICDGESYTVGSSTYITSGVYQDVLTSTLTGCDSIVNLDLTVHEVYDVELFEDICTGSEYQVGDSSFSEPGTYTQVLSSQEGCDSVVTLNLFVYPCELVYDRAITNVSCNGLSDGNFSFRLTVGTPPYQYTWQSLSGTGQSGSGTLDGNNLEALVDGLPAGNYRIEVVDSSPFNVSTSFTINISEPQPLDISMELSDYNNYNTSCNEESDGWIDASVTGGTPPYSYFWSTGDRNEDIDGLAAGTYGLTITDQNLCPDSANTALVAPPPLEARLAVTDPPCFGDELGIIRVNEVNGGVSPYLYGVDENPLSTVPQFTNLPIGAHMVQVQDANGCMWEDEEMVNQPEQLIVELGDDKEIKLGDSVQLFAQTSYPVEFYNWASPIDINCDNCPDPFVRPLESMAFSVTTVDENGCRATDRITVFVNRKRDVYIPNVFSPNNDGQNDVFLIFGGDEAVEIKSFYIFNRWGEPMFELFNFPPNDPTYGWDGTHRGELMNGGVYVYMAEIEFVDGVVELFKGDVLLMR